jgi:23S rRNA pseudouridine2605 synthase
VKEKDQSSPHSSADVSKDQSTSAAGSAVRIQKFLSSAGVFSRRSAEQAILDGRVSVNGQRINTLGVKITPGQDEVRVDGTVVNQQSTPLVVLYYKPFDVVSTMYDPQGRTALSDMLPDEYSGLFPVGRLDRYTTGLLVFTNDGDLAEVLLHPRYEFVRSYEAIVEGAVRTDCIQEVARGMELEDGFVQAELEILGVRGNRSQVAVHIKVGRKHIVRRLLAALGHPVIELHRTAHGPLSLGNLQPGEFYELPKRDYRALRKALGL